MKKSIKLILCIVILISFIVTSLGLTAIAVKSIKINVSNVKIAVGKTYKLKVTFTPANATNKKVVFSSADKSIATVSTTGYIKGIKTGKTAITVTSASNKKAVAKCSVTIFQGNLNPAGVLPIVNKKVQISVWAAVPNNISDLEKNRMTVNMEKATNVKIKWMRVSTDDADQKFNLMMASQSDLPDIICKALSKAQQISLADQKLIIPLNKLIDDYGVYTKKIFSWRPTIQKQLRAPDGNIYGLPEYNECRHCRTAQRMWINQKWLDRLGLKMPKTTEDFYQVLKSFKEKDANGNGNTSDEIPLTGYLNSWYTNPVYFLMNAFAYSDDAAVFTKLVKGKVTPSFIQAGWKNGLKYNRRLYSEGLLDKEVFIQNQAQVKALSENSGGNRIGVAAAGHHGLFTDLAKDTKLEYVAQEPLIGPDGTRQTKNEYTIANGAGFITSKSKYKEIAFRWLEELPSYTTDVLGSFTKNGGGWGTQGKNWDWAKEGDIGITGGKALWRRLGVFDAVTDQYWGFSSPSVGGDVTREAEASVPGTWSIGGVLTVASRDHYEPYQIPIEDVIPPVFLPEKVETELSELKLAIKTYVDEMTAQFVTGALDIEANWDKYLAELNKIGVKRYVEILQDAYEKN